MTVNSQLSKTESKKIKTKNKQLEQEKNQRSQRTYKNNPLT